MWHAPCTLKAPVTQCRRVRSLLGTVIVGTENSHPISLEYDDFGSGPPVVLIHGWPLSRRSWERQVPPLLTANLRVIAYDRRGFGSSSHPATGYDFQTLSADLHALIEHLDLREVTLVGFSMGGGEIARYLGNYGDQRIARAVFISAIPPFLLKTRDNPAGVEGDVFEILKNSIERDRPAFLARFLPEYFNINVLAGVRVSDEAVRLSWNDAADASPIATLESVAAWLTDFRGDLAKICVPTLVIHGDADRVLPLHATGMRTHDCIRGSELVVLKDGPHGLIWTHAQEVNAALLNFIRTPSSFESPTSPN